jgi:hypothetical protein
VYPGYNVKTIITPQYFKKNYSQPGNLNLAKAASTSVCIPLAKANGNDKPFLLALPRYIFITVGLAVG